MGITRTIVKCSILEKEKILVSKFVSKLDSVLCFDLYEIHQTRETVFHRDIQAHDVQQSIFHEIQDAWVDDETLS